MDIFNLINKDGNDCFKDFNENDLQELINRLEEYYLTLRDKLGLGYETTFGFEIEFEDAMKERIEKRLADYFGQFQEEAWVIAKDLTCGFEVRTDILIDNKRNWQDIKEVCKIVNKDAFISSKCGGHIHIGAQTIGSNLNTWLNFLKIWSTYENIIFRFTSGEFLATRPNAILYATPLSNTFWEIYNKALQEGLSVNEIIKTLGKKRNAINFLNVNNLESFDHYNTIEFRCPNATLNPVIWQNNLNLFTKLIMRCKSEVDSLLIDKRHDELVKNGIPDNLKLYNETINLRQALEFCDLIFTNNLDKVYFLKQYLKSFKISIEPYYRAKKFTRTI